MNAPAPATGSPAETERHDHDSWSRPRWVFYVTLAFAAHLGLIFSFGNRHPVVPRAVANAPTLQLSTRRSELQTLGDPMLFASPHPRGFAAGSWLKLPLVEFAPIRWTEPPQLLLLPPLARLGTAFLHYAQTNVAPPLELETLPPPGLAQLEAAPQPTALRQSSTVRVNGRLANRRWLNAPAILRSWPAADLLTNSIVQVLTDTDGLILSAALMPPGSGSKAADQRALDLARSARFAPANRTSGNLTVGTLVFEWHTAPLPETNSPPAKP